MSAHRRRLATLTALAAGLVAADWPDTRWVPLTRGGAPLADPQGDPSVDDSGLDFVDAGAHAGAWYLDASHLFVRLRLAGEPGPTWTRPGRRYGVLLDTDDDAGFYELAASFGDDGLWVYDNTALSTAARWTDPPDDAEEPVSSDVVADDLVRVVSAAGGWWVELAIPVDSLHALGFSTDDPLALALVTDANGVGAFTVDLAGADNDTDPTLADGLSDPLPLDEDGDGAVLGVEEANGLDPSNPDTDGDGIEDGPEALCGGHEDDRDNDGVADTVEGTTDSDSDGSADFCDPDDDGDGWPTATEGPVDTDGDGLPDYLDEDSDDDGIPDREELLEDRDCDGLRARLDRDETDGPCGDPDGDGLSNTAEEACGTDPLLADTDGDGQPDGLESCTDDTDGDGLVDALDGSDEASSVAGAWQQDSGLAPFSGGHFSGGGCASTSGRAHAVLALLALLLVGRRRRLVALTALSTPAAAAGLDAQRHRAATGPSALLVVEDGRRQPAGPGALLRWNQADDPLVYRVDGQTDTPVLDRVGTLSLTPWAQLGPVRVALDAPVHVVASGFGVPTTNRDALGDLGLSVQASLAPRGSGWGAAIGARGTAPTGTASHWLGEDTPTVGTFVAGSVGRSLRGAATVGYLWTPETILGDLAVGPRATFGAGASWWVTPWGGLSTELTGEHLLGASGHPAATPVEWISALGARPLAGLQVRVGAGFGLTGGVGSPRSRWLLDLRLRQPPDDPQPRPPSAEG